LAWSAEFSPDAEKALASLDKPVQRRIRDFIDSRAPARSLRTALKAIRPFVPTR